MVSDDEGVTWTIGGEWSYGLAFPNENQCVETPNATLYCHARGLETFRIQAWSSNGGDTFENVCVCVCTCAVPCICTPCFGAACPGSTLVVQCLLLPCVVPSTPCALMRARCVRVLQQVSEVHTLVQPLGGCEGSTTRLGDLLVFSGPFDTSVYRYNMSVFVSKVCQQLIASLPVGRR